MYKISLPPLQKSSYSQQAASGGWGNKGVRKKLSPPLSFYYSHPLQLFPPVLCFQDSMLQEIVAWI